MMAWVPRLPDPPPRTGDKEVDAINEKMWEGHCRMVLRSARAYNNQGASAALGVLIALLIAILLIIFFAGCVSHPGRALNTIEAYKGKNKIDVAELATLPQSRSTQFNLRVSFDEDLRKAWEMEPRINRFQRIRDKLDSDFLTMISEWPDQYTTPEQLEKVLSMKIIIVPETFTCPDNISAENLKDIKGVCNGYTHQKLGVIVLAYKAVDRKGDAPLYLHEIGHIVGLVKSDHGNKDEYKPYTDY